MFECTCRNRSAVVIDGGSETAVVDERGLHFEKAAQAQRSRGRIQPQETRVARFVARRKGRIAEVLARILRTRARSLAEEAATAYIRVVKADEDVVRRILEQMATGELSVALLEELTPELAEAFRKAGAYGALQVGLDITPDITRQVDAAAVAYAEKRAAELIKDFAGTTDTYLRSVIASAVEDGASPADLADAIEASGAFGEGRAETIARTELAFAHVQGNVEGWRASGEVVGKRWILGDLHDVEDECDECAQVGVVGMDEEFIEGIDFPPAHPNCICDVVPVLRDEEEEA